MKRRREPAGPQPRPVAGGRAGASTSLVALELTVVLLCVALALWTQRRALGGFFSLDDLVIMEEVRGLRPAAVGLWRLVSRHLYFGAAVPLFGSNPFPYHLLSWLLHGVNVGLLYLFVRRVSGSALPAAFAAGLFGTTRLHFTAIGTAACVGEPLALGLTLGALLLHARGRLAAAAGAVLFALAMLSKESVVLLPFVTLLPFPGAGRLRERLRLAAPLLALGATIGAALVATGTGTTHLAGEAYARDLGPNLFFNLMTYTAWATDLKDSLTGLVSVISPHAWPVGVAGSLVIVLVVVAARRTTRLPAFGAVWWLLALVPVLPLLHHTYAYYLYVPLAGLAMWFAGAIEWAMGALAARTRPAGGHGRAPARAALRLAAPGLAVAAAVVSLLAVGHAWWSDRLIAERVALRMQGTGVPLDPDLRKSEIARHASAAVAKHLAGRPGRVAFLLPESLRQIYSTATGEVLAATTPGSESYTMLAGALDDGRGLRALHANVDSVAFLPGWKVGYADFELFAQGRDGTVFSLGRGPDGYAEAGAAMLGSGDVKPARELLEGALSEFPSHARLRFQYAHALHLDGDSLAMRRQLEELVRRSPADPLAARVRAGFERERLGRRGDPGGPVRRAIRKQ
ncbi:MAG: tetratricopeptide repeat protein [Candidatus Eisenbacteria bacterium]